MAPPCEGSGASRAGQGHSLRGGQVARGSWRRSWASHPDPAVRQREPARPLPQGGRGAPPRGARARISTRTAARRSCATALGRAARGGPGAGSWSGNGADELLALLARAAYDPGDEVVVPHPAFEPYGTEATAVRARRSSRVPLAGYETDLDDMQRRVTPRTKAVIICTPAQSGLDHRAPTRRLERFIGALGGDPPLVILDEAYRDFCDDPETADGVDLVRARSHRDLAPDLLEDRRARRPSHRLRDRAGPRPSSGSTGCARPTTSTGSPRSRRWPRWRTRSTSSARAPSILAERPRLAATRWQARRSVARRPRPTSSSSRSAIARSSSARRLLEAGILVRDGAGVGFPGHLRIAIGTPAQNDRLLAAWDQATEAQSAVPHAHRSGTSY